MNLFPTDPCPFKSAQALDDKRLVRQASEAVLILSTAAHVLGVETYYKPHQPEHELVQWLASSGYAFSWGYCYATNCGTLYKRRYGRECKSQYHLRALLPLLYRKSPWNHDPHPFFNCARHQGLGLDFTHLPPHEAYQAYLNARWQDHDKRAPVWSAGVRPAWTTCTRGRGAYE